MKYKLLPLSLCLSIIGATTLRAEPFTYQGKLENSGAPFTGSVTITLSLFTTASGGAPIRTQSFPGTAVSNGVFSVTATTFLAADFNGASRYLEISVDDGQTSNILAPRQQVTWAAMAMHAKKAETVTGSVPTSQLTGTISPSMLGDGSTNVSLTFGNGGTLFSSLVGTPPFRVSNTTKIPNLNSDLFDGLDSSAFLLKAGGTMTGPLVIANGTTLSFGNKARQMVNLFNGDYAIGVQSDTIYQRSLNDWSWHRGGTHSDSRNDPGSGGTEIMRLAGNDLWLRGSQSGSGLATPRLIFGPLNNNNQQPLLSIGRAPNLIDSLEITANKVRLRTNTPGVPPSITFGANTGEHVVLFENGSDTYSIGVQGSTQYFRTGEHFAWYRDGKHSDAAFSPGIGGAKLLTLSGTGTLIAHGSESGFNVVNRNNNTQQWALYSRNSGPVGQFAIWNNGTGDVAAFSPNGNLYLVGEVSTTVLTIRGGADVAEPFAMTRPEEMEPGTVVIIDEDNPGHLKESNVSYDTRVAGIISGAGGVQPGLRLHQEGVMEGDHHVALSGRVYVKADAAYGTIKPGDLLTTSSTPGHAMKVKDHQKAQGAILGKAMSRLDQETGLVLVLVTLQ